jgi:hypothetical protein
MFVSVCFKVTLQLIKVGDRMSQYWLRSILVLVAILTFQMVLYLPKILTVVNGNGDKSYVGSGRAAAPGGGGAGGVTRNTSNSANATVPGTSHVGANELKSGVNTSVLAKVSAHSIFFGVCWVIFGLSTFAHFVFVCSLVCIYVPLQEAGLRTRVFQEQEALNKLLGGRTAESEALYALLPAAQASSLVTNWGHLYTDINRLLGVTSSGGTSPHGGGSLVSEAPASPRGSDQPLISAAPTIVLSPPSAAAAAPPSHSTQPSLSQAPVASRLQPPRSTTMESVNSLSSDLPDTFTPAQPESRLAALSVAPPPPPSDN